MKYKSRSTDLLLFGGCYSNLQATQKMKEIADAMGFSSEQIICTGDVVGYCAQPEETVDLIRNWNIDVIAGNVEVQLRDGAEDCGCNFDDGSRCDLFSRSWFPYAQNELSEDSIQWMKDLKTFSNRPWQDLTIGIIHGGKENISQYIFESTNRDVKERLFRTMSTEVMIAGHCGLPFYEDIDSKLWINPGVIGMPANDGTPRVWFAILKPEGVEMHSFNYNHQEASILMQNYGLPKEYAKTLLTGIWDNCEILPKKETAMQGKRIQEDFHWS